MNSSIIFPLFRKYPNDKSYFKILSDQEFIEYTLVGQYYSVNVIKASILPDRNYLMDLIENTDKNYLVISEEEFESAIHVWKTTKKLLS